MIYLDTSVLGSLFFREPTADAVILTLRTVSRTTHVISAWTLTEMASVGAIKVRTGVASEDERADALSTFQRFASAKFKTVEVEPSDFRSAAILIDQASALRGGDALHLAISKRIGATMVTLDRRLESCAKSHGVKVLSITLSA